MRALLIIDMVKGFVDKTTEDGDCALYLPNARSIIPNINRVIEKLDKDDIIIHMNDSHEVDDEEFKMFPKHCIEHTKESRVASGFVYGDRCSDVISKTRFSAFHRTVLASNLHTLGINELIITGVCTEICIMYTVADARMRDMKVTVVKNAVSGLTEDGHEWALGHMKNVLGANIVGE